ncbi:MAG TPA: endolytic transglycosylase MltG [Bryobacteraceae bacterium]|nr:endolytic transglycosylase MltG [Bryobacteraceae bacterium]
MAVLLAIAALAAGWALLSPYRGFEGDTYVDIPRGTGAVGIAQALADGGVIRYPWQFWLMRATHPSAKLQAGEYRFATAASVREVFDRIARGDIFYFEFTVPEGSNIFDIARALEAQGVMAVEDFLSAATDASSIRDLAPKAKTLEGYLFPSTYRLSHHTTPAQLCKRMTDEFRKEWNRLAAGQTAEVHRTVTLASLIEKETGVAEERPLIAGVFTNRLEKGMRLECDPTTIYAALLDKRYRGAIHRSDLASANPYNTYQNAGLPPGPIANPGAQALTAALHPAETNYLFFVAKPSGDSHHFSASIAEHEKAVEAYRRASHNRKAN